MSEFLLNGLLAFIYIHFHCLDESIYKCILYIYMAFEAGWRVPHF